MLATSLGLNPLDNYSYMDSDSSSMSNPNLTPCTLRRFRDSICTIRYLQSIACFFISV